MQAIEWYKYATFVLLLITRNCYSNNNEHIDYNSIDLYIEYADIAVYYTLYQQYRQHPRITERKAWNAGTDADRLR